MVMCLSMKTQGPIPDNFALFKQEGFCLPPLSNWALQNKILLRTYIDRVLDLLGMTHILRSPQKRKLLRFSLIKQIGAG